MKKAIGCLILTLFIVFAAYPVTALAEPTDTRTLATVNKPGVVLLQTVWTADVTLHEFDFVASFTDDLMITVEEMVNSGQIPETEEAVYSTLIQLMTQYMGDYAYRTGNVATSIVSTGAVGTGFIVTPDGYLVTNAHVVATDEEAMYMNFAQMGLSEVATTAAQSLVADMRRLGYEPTQEEIDAYSQSMMYLVAQNIELGNLQTSYSCYLGNVTPGSDVSTKGLGLDLRKMGEPIPGKDIAILKIDNRTNLPTVTLGDDTKLKTGDQVYAMGYPAVATLADTLNVAQAIQEPTLTQGIISARKQMAGGWNIFQTDADIHGGNSGGPLFNAEGEVIGINTFGMIDSSGASASGMNFAVPISLVKQFLNEINVTPAESQFTMNFKKAQTLFDEGKYNESLELLRGLNETNPGFPVVQELLAEARQAADVNPAVKPQTTSAANDGSAPAMSNDTNKNTGSLPPIILYAIIGGGVILCAIIVIIILGRRKKNSTTQSAAVASAPKPATPVGKSLQHCSNCGAELSDNAKFCNACGQSVPKGAPDHCPSCNAPLRKDAKFCDECGSKITL